MRRRPPRSTRTDTLFPDTGSADLRVGLAHSLGERDVPSGVVGAQGVADFGRDEDHAAGLPSTAARSLLPRWSSLASTAASGRKTSDRTSTSLHSSHYCAYRMPSSARQ